MITDASFCVTSNSLPFMKVEQIFNLRFVIAVHLPNGNIFVEDINVGWTAHNLSLGRLIRAYPTKDDAIRSAMDFLILYEAGLSCR